VLQTFLLEADILFAAASYSTLKRLDKTYSSMLNVMHPDVLMDTK
jgi:hypothetical protein